MVTIINLTIGSGRQPCRILRLFRLREHPSGLTTHALFNRKHFDDYGRERKEIEMRYMPSMVSTG
jgi:hypothetical protein